MEIRICPVCNTQGTPAAYFCTVCGTGLRRPDWGWQDLWEAARLMVCNPGQVALLSLLLMASLAALGLIGDRLYAALAAAAGWTSSLGRALGFLWILAVLFHVPVAGAYTVFLKGARTGRLDGGSWTALRLNLVPILGISAGVLALWFVVSLGVIRLTAFQNGPAKGNWLIPGGTCWLSGILGLTYLHLALLELADRNSPGLLALRRARAILRRGSWRLLFTVGLALGIGLLGLGVLGVGVLLTGPLVLSVLVRAYLRLSPGAEMVPPTPVWPSPYLRLPLTAWAGLGLLAVSLTGGLFFHFARSPWSSASCRRSGDRLIAAGEPAQALSYYRRWALLQPSNPDAHIAVAKALAATQRWQEAVQEYQTALRFAETADVHLALADLQYQQGNRKKARTHYEAALRLDPSNVEAQLALADMQCENGELKEAAAAYEKALALVPENATAFHNLGEIRAKLGQTDLAIAAYREAARLGSEYPETYTALATLLKKRGQWQQAVQAYESALRLQPQDGKLLQLLQEARLHAVCTVLGTGPLAGLELTILSTQVNAVAGTAQGVNGPSHFEGVFLFLEIRLRNVTDQKMSAITWPDGTVWLQVGSKKILPTLLYTGDRMFRLNLPDKPWKAPILGSLPPGASRDRVLLFPGRQFPTGATQGVLQGTHFPPINVGWEG